MDAENLGVHHLRRASVDPQLVAMESVPKVHQNHCLSSIQENPPGKISKNRKKNGEEGEIGVFSAEKYFSVKLDNDTGSAQNNSVAGKIHEEQDNREELPWMRSRSKPGTPSIRSESSYNSQTFLLRNSMRNYHNHRHQTRANKHGRMNEKSVISLGGFRCNGPCSGGKSVNTNRKILSHDRSSRSSGHNAVTYDARKLMDRPRIPVEAKKLNHHGSSKAEDFFATQIQKADIAMNLERKLSMLTWDAVPNAPPSCYLAAANKNNNNNNINISSSIRPSKAHHDDAASDASSDLFEIENITSSVYEPSEASVEWSVVTRSMADQSVVSDFDDKRLSGNTLRNSIMPVAGNKSSSAGKGGSGGILSGCKSYKAVTVVESAYSSEKQAKVHQIPRRKFQTEVRIEDLDFL